MEQYYQSQNMIILHIFHIQETFQQKQIKKSEFLQQKEEQKVQVQPKVIKNEAKNDFTQSLKYQVVKDIAQQMQKEKLEEIKESKENNHFI